MGWHPSAKAATGDLYERVASVALAAEAAERDKIIQWLQGCQVDNQGRLILSRSFFILSNLKTMG